MCSVTRCGVTGSPDKLPPLGNSRYSRSEEHTKQINICVGQTGSFCTLKHDEDEQHTAQSRDKAFSCVVGLTLHRNMTVTKVVQVR